MREPKNTAGKICAPFAFRRKAEAANMCRSSDRDGGCKRPRKRNNQPPPSCNLSLRTIPPHRSTPPNLPIHQQTPKRDGWRSVAAFAIIAAMFLGVLLTSSHRLWRVLVVSIAAAMTHSLSFFAARVGALPRNVYWEHFLP